MTAHLLRLLAACIICIAATLPASAQRTMRPKLRPDPAAAVTAKGDSTIAASDSSFTLFGYEKTLRSLREAVFVTNRTGAPVTSITLRAVYTMVDGSEVHSRVVTIPARLEAGQTMQVTFPAWDRQQVWHYRLSVPSSRAAQATPFDVALRVTSFTTPAYKPE